MDVPSKERVRGRLSGFAEAIIFIETLRENSKDQGQTELLQEIIDELAWRIEYYKKTHSIAP